MNIFEDDIVSFLSALRFNNVEFMLVGGLAVNYYGFNRSTGDVDLWLKDDEQNRIKLVEALKSLKIDGAEAFMNMPLIAGFAEILINNGIYVDFMSDLQFIKQNEFDDCFAKSSSYKLNDQISIQVIHINHLLEEKTQSKRAKDKIDSDALNTILNRQHGNH